MHAARCALLLSLGTFCLAIPAHGAQDPVADPQAACARANLTQSAIIDGFTFASYSSERTGEACFQVIRQGIVIFRRTNDNDGYYLIGQHPNRDPDLQWNVPNIPDGTDIVGLGDPDMVVYSYTGGAHCCLMTWVFQLQPAFRLLATLDAEDSWPAYFAAPNLDGHYYYFDDDWTFAYWPSSFAGSPVAPVILQFVPDGKGGGAYHLALGRMRKPPPTLAVWKKSLRKARATFLPSNGPWPLFIGATLWTTEMRLIYSGHSELAWKFLNQAWPATVPGKEKWLGDFCSRLKTSPWWPDLQPTIKNMPRVCAEARAGSGG